MQIPGLQGVSPATLAKRSGKKFLDDDMAAYAAALAYHTLLAIFPFTIFLLTLLGFLDISRFFDWLLEQARLALPTQAASQVEAVLGEIRDEGRGGLLSFGLAASLWAASSGARSVIRALNAAYGVDESRPVWQRYLLSIAYTVGLAALLIAAAALMMIGPRAMGWLAGQAGIGGAFVTVWTWLRWPVAIALLALTVALVYYFAPNVDQPFRFITPGSVIAVAVWLLASFGFSLYVGNFGNYTATYGGIGAVVVLLVYFFLSSVALLLGAEVNAEIYRAHRGEDEARS